MAEYNLWVKSPYSFFKSSDFLAAVRLHCDLLPEYTPTKWGWTEPKNVFDPDHIEQLILPNGEVDNVFWRSTGKSRANGLWGTRLRNVDINKATHSSIRIDVYKTAHQEKLLMYLKTASQKFISDISILDGCAEAYKSIGFLNGYAPSGGSLFLTTLRHWLPDMPWAVVFGPSYVRMFGKEKLMTTPAYKVEEVGDEMVFIQLTSDMEDIHKSFKQVMEARIAAKKHLGEESFFKHDLAYDFRLSAFNKLTEEEILAKQGKVFKVPEFNLQLN